MKKKWIVMVLLPLWLLTGCGGNGQKVTNSRALTTQSIDAVVAVATPTVISEGGTAAFTVNDTTNVASVVWKDENGVVLSEAFSFTKRFTDAGTYHITALIEFKNGARKEQDLTIYVNRLQPERAANQAPSVNAGADRTVYSGEDVVLEATASDSDGSVVAYRWEYDSTVVGVTKTLTLHQLPEGTYLYRVTVTDDQGATASDTVTVQVLPPKNTPPVAKPKRLTIYGGESKMVVLEGEDPDPQYLTYTIIEYPEHGRLSNGVPNVVYSANYGYTGSDSFTYIVNDGVTNSEPVKVTIDVMDKPIDPATLGTIGGKIRDALSLNPVANALVVLRSGRNVRLGTITRVAVTDANGDFTMSNIPDGVYTAEVTADNYIKGYYTLQSVAGQNLVHQNYAISPVLQPGQTRIVLTWNDQVYDLDSHLSGPDGNGSKFHIYYGDKNGPGASLDHDITSTYGPETITITQQHPGEYLYFVYNFDPQALDELSRSGAKVDVYRNNQLIASYTVPYGSGYYWSVFTLDDNTITPINTISTNSPL